MLRLASPVNSALLSRVALAIGLVLSLYSAADAATLSPESAQTGTYAYQVLRDGEVVGEQRNDFERRGDELRVVTDVRINITLLGINVYDFTQRIEESWQHGQLMSLISIAVDDGDTRNVQLVREGDRLVGTYDGKKRDLPGGLVPSTLWNSAVVEHASVLETTKGRERTFTVEQKGVEQVTAADRHRQRAPFRVHRQLQARGLVRRVGRAGRRGDGGQRRLHHPPGTAAGTLIPLAFFQPIHQLHRPRLWPIYCAREVGVDGRLANPVRSGRKQP